MKRLLLTCIALFTLLSLFSKDRVIERPPFSVRNYGTLEIEKIVLNKKATVIHFTGYQQPGWWFRIDAGSYIIANGQKYLVESADGLKLDEETYPDETGKRPFTLTFPPIDPKTKQIDFIESDCDDCFKIWGIELRSDVLTNRIPVPEEIKKLATTEVTGTLQPTGFRMGNAHLKGQLLGYRPGMKIKGEMYVNNPLTGDQEEYTFAINDDGTFDTQIPLPTSMQVLIGFSGLLWNAILMSPGEETLMYLDLQQKSCRESRARKDRCTAGKWIYFGGSFADINNYFYDNNLSSFIGGYFNYEQMMVEIAGMSAPEFKNYILDKQAKAQQALLDKKLPAKVNQLMEINIRQNTIYWLSMGDHFLETAYRKKNNIDRSAPIPDYNVPVFDVEYYSFLKDMDLNNPLNLYSVNYSGTVNSCSYLSLRRKRSFTHFLSDIAEELIRITDMSPEEIAYVEYQITSQSNQNESFVFEETPPYSQEFISEFHEKYREEMGMLYEDIRNKESQELLSEALGTDRGLLFDLILVKNYASSLEEMVPVSKYRLQKVQQLDNPFYYEYLTVRNAEIMARLEANKDKSGYTVYATPGVENEALLDEIIKPYKGKVIFVDFWNTWCGPCRSAMKQFDPTKEQYKDKDVVFLYLADHSSPLKTWENMISDISGEHYRLESQQMEYLSNKYGVTGIPSYLILDKTGEQVFFQVGFPGNNKITEILDRELAK